MSTAAIKVFKELQDYEQILQQMRDFTINRTDSSQDQIWLLQHHPVFTQGQAGKSEHLLAPGDIPVVQSDRGGQVTYHGPGQLVVYFLLNLKQRKLSPRCLVSKIENAVISFLQQQYGVTANGDDNARGVYVKQAKICSIGLRVKRGCSYHGLSFNVNMDLEPFERINPCGYKNLKITQLRDFNSNATVAATAEKIVPYLNF